VRITKRDKLVGKTIKVVSKPIVSDGEDGNVFGNPVEDIYFITHIQINEHGFATIFVGNQYIEVMDLICCMRDGYGEFQVKDTWLMKDDNWVKFNILDYVDESRIIPKKIRTDKPERTKVLDGYTVYRMKEWEDYNREKQETV
jgi:hypothetical protein